MTKRDELRQLVDELSDADVDALLGVAQRLRVTMAPAADDVPEALAHVPVDDAPLSDQFLARMAGVEAGIARGEPGIPSEQVWADLLG